jgi:hypothetical protein
MGRFILRFTGRGAMPDADRGRIRSTPGVVVLDDSSSRMLLVQAPPRTVGRLVETLPDWTSTPEQTVPLPDPRPKIRSS